MTTVRSPVLHRQATSAPATRLEPASGSSPLRGVLPGIAVAQAQAQSLRWPLVWALAVLILIVWGMHARLERYITPQRGLGYWLGIVGASMMLLLLIYSARKRAAWLAWLGSIPAWFRIHMVLGVAGPLLVLFHANFRLGATNSNVALICMLLVSGSGVIGRYFYTRIHAHLDGKQDTLEELKAVAERIRTQTTTLAFLPDLLSIIDREEQRLIRPDRTALGRILHVFTAGVRAAAARWRVRVQVQRALAREMVQQSPDIARHARRIGLVACHYANRRLDAARRIAEYSLYARLFSFWHVLHIPLFFMLLFAGVAHVIAVNVY